MKKIMFINIAFCVVFIACSDAPAKNANLLLPEQGFVASLDTAHYTTIQWVDSTQNFGTVREGDSVKVSYTFINTGHTPLFLSAVRTSCGCTVVSFLKQAILPGHAEKLVARVNSRFHPGHMRKSIVVTSNTTNNVSHTLVLEGNVIKQTGK